MTNPYAEHAFDYKAKGYSPLPLPERRKKPVPDGYTGSEGVMVSGPDIQEWIDKGKNYNIAIRMPRGVIGIDVDDYDDKTGGQTMRQAVEMFGRLPVIGRLTSRYGDDPVSGIRLFRVPTDAVLVAQLSSAGLGPHVEILQFHHRYAVAPGSIHPDTGASYEWVLSDGTFGELPAVADLPELPAAWLEALTPKRAEVPLAEVSHAAYDAMDERTQAKARSYVDKAIAAIYAELDAMKSWDDSYRNERGEGWEEGVLQRTLRLAQFVKADWNPLTVEEVLRSLKKCLPRDSGFPIEGSLGKFLRALNNDQIAGAWFPLDDDEGMDLSGIRDEGSRGKGSAGGGQPDAGDPPADDDAQALEDYRAEYFQGLTGGDQYGILFKTDNCREVKETKDGDEIEKKVRPYTTARRLLALWPIAKQPLNRSQAWWSYRDGVWALNDSIVRLSLAASFKDSYTIRDVAPVEDVMATMADELEIEPHPDYINLRNGMLDWRTGELLAHDASYHSTVQLPHKWNATAECSRFDAWLAERLPADGIRLAWELIAVALYSGNPVQRAGLLYGVGKSGKSTYLEVIMGLIGRRNCAALSPQDMTKTVFATHSLLGKQANIVTDIDPTKITETATFKRVVASEAIQAQQKNRPEFMFRPFATNLFSANQIPRTADRTSAWTRRFAILRFDHTLGQGRMIDRYHTILLQEAEGIIAKAVRILPDVLAQGDYSVVEADQDEFEAATDFTTDFWSEAVTITGQQTDFVFTTQLAQAFELWCTSNRIKHAPPFADVELKLRDDPKVEKARRRMPGTGRGSNPLRGWKGLVISPEYLASVAGTHDSWDIGI